MTTTAAEYFKQTDGVATYSTNYIAVNMRWGGTTSNGGNPVIIIDTYPINVWVNAFQPGVDGTFNSSLVVASPATTYLTNTWGTPTVVASAGALY
jgi:hypothetical protein